MPLRSRPPRQGSKILEHEPTVTLRRSHTMKKNPRIQSIFLLLGISLPLFAGCSKADKYDGLDALVVATHQASLVAREKERKDTVSKKSWPDGTWGDTLWSLNALYQNEKTDEANARLLKNAQSFLEATTKEGAPAVFLPENLSEKSPWAYFALPDYVRILCLFRAENTKFPGRLQPETEAAMKAALWVWAKGGSKVADTTLDNLQVLLGTENHDLTLKQFTMFLDLCFIEEAQMSVYGRRGGGRSRAGYGKNNFESYKNVLYAPEGKLATTSHTAIIETSDYQLPAAAIALRFLEFPAAQPFVIEDRVLGQGAEGEGVQRLSDDSALVNYAWRTPQLILGSTLQDPALATAAGTHGYLGISRQNRSSSFKTKI